MLWLSFFSKLIRLNFLLFALMIFSLPVCQQVAYEQAMVKGKEWEKLTLQFTGPSTHEMAEDNPFLNYRLIVTFKHPNKTMKVPGFYAADGNAAETSAAGGTVWKVHFRPDQEGLWDYVVSFRKGKDIAISDKVEEGIPTAFDGETGNIKVSPNPNADGRLQYTGERYLQYAESEKYFIKGGAGSPENVLGYKDIDGTVRGQSPQERKGEATANAELHHFEKHLQDWKIGDPTWQNGKGKSLIGGLNYLAAKGLNSIYFLTMNIDGDGKEVYPYTAYDERLRFDCSKLDQWEIVFDHLDQLGILMHVILQETENELLLDGGNTTYERKLYLREMIARFAHHPRLVWNMGEENGPVYWHPEGQSTEQQKAMVAYTKTQDPYNNVVLIHSHADQATRDQLFEPLLGFKPLDGISMQVADKANVHEVTKQWIEASEKANRKWIVSIDEIGPWWRGVDPDDRPDNNQDTVRAEALWGNLMAGGAGAEWYFGAKNHSNDLNCEDWRTRDRMWTYTSNAIHFFNQHIPFQQMESHDELLVGDPGYCFAKEGAVYLIYLNFGGQGIINLQKATGTFTVKWYNPRLGGELQNGSISTLQGGQMVSFGLPPSTPQKDWAILIEQK